MGKKLYVGNLAYGVTDSTLSQLFEAHGTVQSAQVIMDRDTGRSKGFGFVEMGSDAEAQAAIQALNGKEVEGRALTVNEARPKAEVVAAAAAAVTVAAGVVPAGVGATVAAEAVPAAAADVIERSRQAPLRFILSAGALHVAGKHRRGGCASRIAPSETRRTACGRARLMTASCAELAVATSNLFLPSAMFA
jgi:RNA recognition motif. (a.k.a. RRM, RBD, or RNP domain)